MYNRELYHHGIKGQRWGERHGPPYPLKPGAHSEREKKLNGTSGSDSESDKKKRKLVTDGEKIVSQYFGSSKHKTLEDRYMEKHYKKWASRSDTVVDDDQLGFEKIKNPKSPEEEIDEVNPFYNKSKEYQSNCVNCTLAYELRQRGYDVRATENSKAMSTKEVISYFDKDFKSKNVKEEDFLKGDENLRKLHGVEKGAYIEEKIKEKLSSSYPPNSRGAILIPTKIGGHAMSFSIDSKGKVKILNPQDPSLMSSSRNNEFHSWLSYFEDSPKGKYALRFTMMRYDNAKFKSDINRTVNKVTKGENIKSSTRALATTYGPAVAVVSTYLITSLLAAYLRDQ